MSNSRNDTEWAQRFVVLYTFLDDMHPKSEDAMLLLSTCRNAYLTINAEFADIQELFGPLRAGLEMIDQGSQDGPKIKERFQEALAIIKYFDDKKRVWKERDPLHKSITQAFKEYKSKNALDAAWIEDLVNVGLTNNSENAKFLCLDFAEPPGLDRYFKALNQLRDLSEAIARFGISYVDTIIAPPPVTADLFSDRGLEALASSKEIPVDHTVAHWAEKIASNCDWVIQQDENSEQLHITVKFKHLRPDTADKKRDYMFKRGSVDEVVAHADAAAFLREALWYAHHIAAKTFEPNSSRQMPSVFKISLPLPRPAQVNAEGIQPLELERKHCRGGVAPTTYKVALTHLTIPFSAFNKVNFAFVDNKTHNMVETDVIKAIQAAKDSDCQALVFPEYSIPKTLRSQLLEFATNNNVTIIGGFEGSQRDNKLADEAFVAIPDQGKLYSQYKQSPSLEEPLPGGFFCEGKLLLFVNSPIGDFSVVVCSDFLEIATLNAWSPDGPFPDTLFVIARNPYPKLYEHFAITDSLRLYCSVAVCNVCDKDGEATSEGTFVVSPRRDETVDLGTEIAVDGTYLKKITVHEIPISSIRARERGKPDTDFFAVPRSAKRTPGSAHEKTVNK